MTAGSWDCAPRDTRATTKARETRDTSHTGQRTVAVEGEPVEEWQTLRSGGGSRRKGGAWQMGVCNKEAHPTAPTAGTMDQLLGPTLHVSANPEKHVALVRAPRRN